VHEQFDTKGKVRKTDAVRCAFARAKTHAKVKAKKTFNCFRKTGADMLKKQYQDQPHIFKLYLAQSTDPMVSHYTQAHFDALHEATDWLGKNLGLFDTANAKPKKAEA
jgi:hypothetical protein